MTIPLFRDDAYLQTCEATVVAITEQGVVLDRTVFYPTGGGQAGDTGFMMLKDGQKLSIIDTRKGEARDSIVHFLAADSAKPSMGDVVKVQLDWERRYKLMQSRRARTI